MSHNFSLFIIALVLLLTSCTGKSYVVDEVFIIPKPNQIKFEKGNLQIDRSIHLFLAPEFHDINDFISTIYLPYFDLQYDASPEKALLRIEFDPSILKEEGYILDITHSHISIKASSAKGVFYAFQTFRQILPAEMEHQHTIEHTILPCISIHDAPRFPYRGMHLDVSRHFFSVDFIKKYIDLMALLKMNRFHWHLTDDQGWRIEIKKYPKLNSIGSYRKETLVGHYNDNPQLYDGERYGGYYTQEDVKDIIQYATNRHITVIPEIEMPGHSQAAIAAYPELGCSGEQVEVATKWGVFDEVYCPKENTFDFLKDVLDEVLSLFPSKVIHIGGDEAPKTRWKNCKHCQTLMKKEGLQDEMELQSYFIKRIETYLNGKGRQIIGWDEILEGGLAPKAKVMSWRGVEGGISAAEQKHDVVMTPTSHCYFDYYQNEHADEPLAIGGYLPLKKVYAYDPIPRSLEPEFIPYILGAQGNVWTEYMKTEDQVEYMAIPRMLAMSEVVWTDKDLKSYDDFIMRLEHVNERLRMLDYNFANHLYEIEGNVNVTNDSMFYSLKAESDQFPIFYTLDESTPSEEAIKYDEPIKIDESTHIKAAVYNQKEQLGRVFEQDIRMHEGVGKAITINVDPHPAYPGSGPQGLLNGISGHDKRYGDKEWLGFWGNDVTISIDLNKPTKLDNIRTRFYNANGQWIYSPSYVELMVDGELVESVETKESTNHIIPVEINCKGVIGQSIQLFIPNYGVIPQGFQGEGNKAWTFIDEIMINQ